MKELMRGPELEEDMFGPDPVQEQECMSDEERRMRFGNNKKKVTKAKKRIRAAISNASRRANRRK